LKPADNKGNIMALIPLNTFKTKTARVLTGIETTTATTVYTAPVGTTAIVLMAQISNVSTVSQLVSLVHFRNRRVLADAQGNGLQLPQTPNFLVKEFEIPSNDAASVLAGKLIVEELDSIRCFQPENATTGTLQLVMSILETANQ
jgi:hypothetical protein